MNNKKQTKGRVKFAQHIDKITKMRGLGKGQMAKRVEFYQKVSTMTLEEVNSNLNIYILPRFKFHNQLLQDRFKELTKM